VRLNLKALKPRPTRQAKLLALNLTYRVPLHFAAILEADIKAACERFNLSAQPGYGKTARVPLLKRVYIKRAKLREEQLLITANTIPWQ
jgi:hypothetical protein